MKPYHLPDRTIIRLTLQDLDTLAEMQYAIYPELFVEKKKDIETLLKGEHMNIGVIVDERLVGFLLTTLEYAETEKDIFLYDIGILPEYQKKGLGTLLINHFFKDSREKKLKIGLSCRNTSFPMFSNPHKLEKEGYRIAKCEFEEDGYFKLVGVHEDIHNIELEPI